jgi:hypothetical protein
MSGRIRLMCAGLLAAATTAVMVAAPAVVQAGITFNLLDWRSRHVHARTSDLRGAGGRRPHRRCPGCGTPDAWCRWRPRCPTRTDRPPRRHWQHPRLITTPSQHATVGLRDRGRSRPDGATLGGVLGRREGGQPRSTGTTASQKSSVRPVGPLTMPRNSSCSSSDGSAGVPPLSMRTSNRIWPGVLAMALPSGP